MLKMMLDWMMVEGYRKLVEEAQQRKEWRRQTFEPVLKAENQKKKILLSFQGICSQDPHGE